MGQQTDPPSELEAWEQECLCLLGPGVVVAGVGNRERGDDGVGPAVAEALGESGEVAALDCGTVPENYVGRIAALRPADVVFADAADLGGPAGTVRLLRQDHLLAHTPSTHSAGLAAVAAFLTGTCSVRCHLLAIQPAATAGGPGLSPPVRAAVSRIAASTVWAHLRRAAPGK